MAFANWEKSFGVTVVTVLKNYYYITEVVFWTITY